MKIYSLLGVLLFSTSLMVSTGFQCYRDFKPSPPEYEFAEKLSLSPYKKTYALNDTIWVQFQTNNKGLFDKLSNSQILTDTTYLQSRFHYHVRYPRGITPEFFCEVIVDNPIDLTFTPQYSYYNILMFKTSCNSSNYLIKVAFILKKKGIFSIEPHISPEICPNKTKWYHSTSNFVFDLIDCNKDVWLSIPAASRGGELGFTDIRIDKKEIFVFKVE